MITSMCVAAAARRWHRLLFCAPSAGAAGYSSADQECCACLAWMCCHMAALRWLVSGCSATLGMARVRRRQHDTFVGTPACSSTRRRQVAHKCLRKAAGHVCTGPALPGCTCAGPRPLRACPALPGPCISMACCCPGLGMPGRCCAPCLLPLAGFSRAAVCCFVLKWRPRWLCL